MDIFVTIVIALGLAIDCFTVAVCAGSSPIELTKRRIIRLAFHFGLFQGGMLVIGWLTSMTIMHLVSSYDHWIALGFLSFIGIRMIRSGIKNEGDECYRNDPTKGMDLVMLSIATSIDALAVGFSMSIMNTSLVLSGLLVGIMSFVLTIVGFNMGDRFSKRLGSRMEIIGGIVLISIGIRTLYTHMVA